MKKDDVTKTCFDNDSGAGTGGSEGPAKSGMSKENPPAELSLGPDQEVEAAVPEGAAKTVSDSSLRRTS